MVVLFRLDASGHDIHHLGYRFMPCQLSSRLVEGLLGQAISLSLIFTFFPELKTFIKKNWQVFEDSSDQGFGPFLEWCVDVVGSRESSVRGYFRHAGWVIEEHEVDARSTGRS